MKGLLFFFSLINVVQFSGGNTLNVLMIPLGTAFNSHFLNFDKMADILQGYSHNVSILVSSRMKPLMKAKNVTFYEAQVPEEDTISIDIDPKILEGYWRIDSIWSFYPIMIR